jgi:hypothetical protein
MEILDEKQQDDGNYLWDIQCTEEEIVYFRVYARTKGKDIENMTDDEIIQFSVVGMLKEQIDKENERIENGQD